MSDSAFPFFKDLPLKTKKERQKKYQYKKIMSTNEMKLSFQEMIKSGMKNTAIIQFIRGDLLDEKVESEQKIRPKRIRSEAEEDVISQFQGKNFSFFIDRMETSNFKRGIDGVLSKLNQKMSLDNTIKHNIYHDLTNPPSPNKTAYSKFSSESRQLSRRKREKKGESLPQKTKIQVNKIICDMNEVRNKRTNTFLFNMPTKKIPKRSSIVEFQIQRDWEEQLLQNVNTLQGTQIRNKRNIKVDREKISSYLRGKFINEIITSYYKFQPSQNFAFLKSTIEQLTKITEKQLKLITFFTYDINQDGFICEEDIYYFISKLPYNSKIVEDFNTMIEFLRKNQLRSVYTNLPQKLLRLRQKSQFTTLTEPNFASKPDYPQKKNSFTEKLFTVAKKTEREVVMQNGATVFKKFQINFEVFTLIFAEKLPVLVSEIILSLIQPITMVNEQPQCVIVEQLPLQRDPSILEYKEREWTKRMSRTKQLLRSFQNENLKLSEKIE